MASAYNLYQRYSQYSCVIQSPGDSTLAICPWTTSNAFQATNLNDGAGEGYGEVQVSLINNGTVADYVDVYLCYQSGSTYAENCASEVVDCEVPSGGGNAACSVTSSLGLSQWYNNNGSFLYLKVYYNNETGATTELAGYKIYGD